MLPGSLEEFYVKVSIGFEIYTLKFHAKTSITFCTALTS